MSTAYVVRFRELEGGRSQNVRVFTALRRANEFVKEASEAWRLARSGNDERYKWIRINLSRLDIVPGDFIIDTLELTKERRPKRKVENATSEI